MLNRNLIDENAIKAIESVISKGDTAQVTPSPGGGVKVVHIQRTIILDTGKKSKYRTSSEMVDGKS